MTATLSALADLSAAVISRLKVGVVVCDLEGRLTAANPAFHQLVGGEDVAVGGWLADLLPTEDAVALNDRFAALLRGEDEAAPLELRMRVGDGRLAYVEVGPSLWRDDSGAPTAFFASVEDVSLHFEREAALKRSEARWRAIFDSAVDAIITCDNRGVILSANPATARLFGYDRDLVGENVAVLMPGREAAEHDSYIRRYLDTGVRRKLGIGRELMGRRADGSQFPIWVALSEIRAPGSHVFLAMLHDLSAVKAAEKALIEARDAALLANRAKTSFLSNVSHELRTPLNGIIGFADVMLGQMGGDSASSGCVAYVGEIKRAGELLLANITDILEIASIEAGAAQMEETLLDFRDVAVSAIRLISKRAQEARLTVEVDLRQEIPPLRADPAALKQVLLHLLSNAVKFTPEDGAIGLSARVEPGDGALVVEVSDTGCGIPAARMEAVFQPFVQGDDRLSRQHEGVGLGLSLARALVERHGGRVTIQSQENVGTTVSLRLPRERLLGPRPEGQKRPA
ncbi:MAG TPA: PAS domain S-box protein [Azospirillaceae bacterium]|nr:PAS domain S-box protein [Azospirillaceae bacterium]HRQ79685.1 PAS domain S-box protein [Azospirillaceae bacterium]